jgi:hypothetical protein|tara:strand:+ start:735 stop:1043 length:309 start_codon:yes stop_codon:yes gene_type:complete
MNNNVTDNVSDPSNVSGLPRGNRTLYASDRVLGAFFEALMANGLRGLQSTHIPHSDVFYVREKYFTDTGEWMSLDRIERSMYLEGMLTARNVLDPHRKRDWE